MALTETTPMHGGNAATLARQQLERGRRRDSRTLSDMLTWLDENVELKKAFVNRHGEDELESMHQFASMQTAMLMAEMRQMQIQQYQRELVPGWMMIEARDLTIQLIHDVLGPAYTAQLDHYGVPEHLTHKVREDMLKGLGGVYNEVAQKAMAQG